MSDPFMTTMAGGMTGGMTGGMAGYCSPLPKWIASLACCIVVGLVVTLIILNSQKSKARSELEACQRNKVSSKDENSKDENSKDVSSPPKAPTLVPAVVKTQNDTKKNNGQNKEKKNKGGKKKGGKKNKGGKNRREGFLWF